MSNNRPLLLLKFDGGIKRVGVKPMHSNDTILIVDGGKTWRSVATSWRMKVRRLYAHLNIEYPL